jgi:hypothetical protein
MRGVKDEKENAESFEVAGDLHIALRKRRPSCHKFFKNYFIPRYFEEILVEILYSNISV